MVLDAMEDKETEMEEIPLLDRHLYGKRDLEVTPRIPSKEEILDQRQSMLQEEIMKRNEEQYEEEDNMNEETYDYSGAFFQYSVFCKQVKDHNTYSFFPLQALWK